MSIPLIDLINNSDEQEEKEGRVRVSGANCWWISYSMLIFMSHYQERELSATIIQQ
jgi:hypothetical protein